jgi:hypothetical protein
MLERKDTYERSEPSRVTIDGNGDDGDDGDDGGLRGAMRRITEEARREITRAFKEALRPPKSK